MSAPPHMPWAMILWNMSLLANSSSTCAGLTSPDMIANSSMSFWVRVREMLALSPAFNSSNVRFSMRSTSVVKLISSPDIVQALGRDATLIGLAGGTTEQAGEKCRGYHVLKGTASQVAEERPYWVVRAFRACPEQSRRAGV